VLADRRFARSTVSIQAGGIADAIDHYQENSTPQLIIVDTDGDSETVLGQVDRLAEVCDAGTNVIVLGAANDIRLYRELLQRGVAEYIMLPVAAMEIAEAASNIFVDPAAPPLGRVIAFMGSRGGAGSSTVSHNVAWHLGETFDEEVTVIDLDITFGTAALAFNLESQQTIDQVLADPSRLDEVLLERYLLEFDKNVRLIAAPARLDADERIVTEPFDQLMELVRRRSSFVVLDIPHRWSPWARQLLMEADESVITGVLDLASLRDSKNLVERLRKERGESNPVRFVLNHAGAYKKTELSTKDFENALEIEPDLTIPHDPNLFGTAANNGQLIGQVNERAKANEAFRELAHTVSGRRAPEKKKKGLALNFQLFSKKKPEPAT
jgi:pilus assembly protein CpaE